MSQLELSNLPSLRTTPNGIGNENEGQEDPPDEKKIPYPKSVFFIIATELSERFSYYGFRAVLTIYMRNMLLFTEDEATTYYHTFLLLCYGLPVVWGIIADSFLGKFKTIWTVSVFFAIGNIILTLSSIPPLQLPAVPLAMLGLLFMSIGTGGMKPCVAPFGGEQFVLPQQAKYLQQFFSVFFFAVTVGNMISTIITPVLRRDVHCFGMETCYPLAFGVPACIMIFAVVIFIAGKSLYKITKPEGNMLVKVVRCIYHALLNKKYSDEKKSHWLDYADDKFDSGLITDIKMLLRVLIYYIPIPMFFALYEQLGSRWTLQATRMSGEIGSFSIKPDQMQVSNAIFMFIFIPVFQVVIYPLFGKCNLLKKPLQRMGVGGFLAALSFCIAGIVELQIEKNHYIPPSLTQTHLKFVNTLPCPVTMNNGLNSVTIIDPENVYIAQIEDIHRWRVALEVDNKCGVASVNNRKWEGTVPLISGALQTVFIFAKDDALVASISGVKEDFLKSNEGNAKIRIVVNDFPSLKPGGFLALKSKDSRGRYYEIELEKEDADFSFTVATEVSPGLYSVSNKVVENSTNPNGDDLGSVEVHPGGSYLLVIHPDYDNRTDSKLQTIIINTPNEVHMLWLVPQYILMAWAEILFIVSGMEFSFTQAPKSMKSVLQSLWHFMNAIGNVIVILSAQTKHTHSQASEFFEFSGAMFIDTIIFCLLALRYKYVDGTVPSRSIRDRNDNQERR